MSDTFTDEASLLRRLRCDSPGAFDELIDAFQGPVFGFVYRLIDDPSEAPDVTQEVFLKVFRKIGDFRGDSSLKTWIYRIAIREASNRRRWFFRHRRNERSVETMLDEQGPYWRKFVDRRGTPFDALQRQEQKAVLEQALRSMDERLRVAVVLRDIEGMSYNEIAETLQISLGTVKSRILRGREALKATLQQPAGVEMPSGAALQPE